MIDILLLALAVFWILKFIGQWIEVPAWFWQLVVLGASALSLAPWNQDWLRWFTPFAIAGIVVLLQCVENVMIAKGDEAIAAVLRSTVRRPR